MKIKILKKKTLKETERISSRACLYAAILALAVLNLSFSWPVRNGRLTSTFCESRADHFHDGIDIVCPDNKVYPAGDGDLMYCWDRSLFPLENYPGGGNYVVIRHGTDICSVYMHLRDGVPLRQVCRTDCVTGTVGNTGHSFSGHLHFSMLDIRKRSSFNPLKEIGAPDDSKAPVISEICLKIGERYVILRDSSHVRLTRHYPLLVRIEDTITGREKLGVYRLSAEINGEKILNTEFGALDYTGRGLISGGRLFGTIFDEKGYYRIEDIRYREGLNRFSFKACDYNGNCAQTTFSIDIDLDIP